MSNIITAGKMLNWFHRVFDVSPHPFLAFVLNYSGTGNMTWSISGGVLSTVTSAPADSLNIQLSGYTVTSLAAYIATLPRYSVSFVDTDQYAGLSALALIDGSAGDISVSNGGDVFGYTNLLWGILSAFASELSNLKQQIVNAIAQMNLLTATDYWAEFHGAYYGIPRNLNEPDPAYSKRIIATTIMPRGNNVAIEAAVYQAIGANITVVDAVDAPFNYSYNGTYTFNGAIQFDGNPGEIKRCLFDIDYGYNLESGLDINGFQAQVVALVNQLRDAGCFLRNISLQSSALTDTVTEIPSDSATMTVNYASLYNGARPFDGSTTFNGLAYQEIDSLS